MYGTLWGKVGIYANYGAPDEKLLTTLETERFFGEMGMIEGLPRSATAVALTGDTKVQVITPETFEAYFQKRPARKKQQPAGKPEKVLQNLFGVCQYQC